jgi:bifunctional non-homologous end joining protein LigD
MSLDEYWRKRDFANTPEPAGTVADTGNSRFVVQRHQARSLHWDFRLEMDGVLKSWAVPKGPPEEPGVRRLAVQVEDHPIEYIDFAGTIPEGYGAGTVEIWDHGTYAVQERTEGKLLLVMSGERLHGRYSLFRTGDGRNWMLLKPKQ